jgi:hypothetical protein
MLGAYGCIIAHLLLRETAEDMEDRKRTILLYIHLGCVEAQHATTMYKV